MLTDDPNYEKIKECKYDTNQKEIQKQNKNESNNIYNKETKNYGKMDYDIFQEDLEKLKRLNDEYKNKNEKIARELLSFKNDNKKLYDQNKKNNFIFNNKISILEKEIIFLKNLILKITKRINPTSLKDIIDQILEKNLQINEIDIDRLRLEKNYEKYENELKAFIDRDKNYMENSELYIELKLKISNVQNKLHEINRKIQERKKDIAILENKFNETKENIINNDRNAIIEKIENKVKVNNILKNDDYIININNAANLIAENSNLTMEDRRNNLDDEINFIHNKANSSNMKNENSFAYQESPNKEIYTEKNINMEENDLNRDNSTANDFYNNHKATNVFKKNYLDTFKNSDNYQNENNLDRNKPTPSLLITPNENKVDSTKRWNFQYKLNSENNNNLPEKKEFLTDNEKNKKDTRDIKGTNSNIDNDNNSDDIRNSNSKELSFEKEIYEKKNPLYKNKSNSILKKLYDGISIDTEKINEKYDKILNKSKENIPIEKQSKNERNNIINSFNKDNLENKLKDIDKIGKLKSNFNKEKFKEEKNNEIAKPIDAKNNIKSLNFNYNIKVNELDVKTYLFNKNEDVDKKKNSTKNNLVENEEINNYNKDSKKKEILGNKNNENTKSSNLFSSDEIEDINKFPEKIIPKTIEENSEHSLNLNNKDVYGLSNNFTFNNLGETENSYEVKSSKASNKNTDELEYRNNLNHLDINNMKNEIRNFNASKKKGFGRKHFEIDI